jgi:hypothetical protein
MSLHSEDDELVATCLVPECDQDFREITPGDAFRAWYAHLGRDHPGLQP